MAANGMEGREHCLPLDLDLPSIDAVIPCAGSGKRMGAPVPKQYLKLGDKLVIEHSAEIFLNEPRIGKVIVVIAEDDAACRKLPFASHPKVKFSIGGAERADSVLSGLRAATGEWVLVHDAARPLLAKSDLQKLINTCLTEDRGGILASPVADTLKLGEQGEIVKTVPRQNLYGAQTPQMFKRLELIKALGQGLKRGLAITDEASAMELCFDYHPLLVMAGSPNFKLTLASDLFLAEALWEKTHSMFRIGHGFDVHRFGGEGPCTLGGVKVPYEQGLIAHSDGDVVIHALCDALLGALALGDIGKLYPDNDDKFLNVDSRILLRDVAERVQEQGYKVVNADITILAQAPKIGPHSLAMRQNLASDLNVELDAVSIKATTTEKLGFTGRKEGIAVEAVALLQKL